MRRDDGARRGKYRRISRPAALSGGRSAAPGQRIARSARALFTSWRGKGDDARGYIVGMAYIRGRVIVRLLFLYLGAIFCGDRRAELGISRGSGIEMVFCGLAMARARGGCIVGCFRG